MKWFSYYDQCCYDIETSQFIITFASILTGFYMMRALTLNWLSLIELEVLICDFVREGVHLTFPPHIFSVQIKTEAC